MTPRRLGRLLAYAAGGAVVVAGVVLAFGHGAAPGVAALCAAILVATALVLGLRLAASGRVTRALTEAAVTTPWPAAQVDAILLRLLQRHVTADAVQLAPRGTTAPLSAPVDDTRVVVLRRARGARGFSRRDARLVAGLAAMARSSHESAVREARLRREAVTDNLTGLWDYGYWRAQLLARAAHVVDPDGVGVVFLDLDGFKQINAIRGHLEADVILAAVGRRLGSVPGWTFCRFGGDEFAGWCTGLDDDLQLDAACEALAAVISDLIELPSGRIAVHASIGRALLADRTADDAIARAERDLRRRKLARPGNGRDRRDRIHQQAELIRQLIDDGDISVAYQPIVELASEAVVGWEALLRARVPGLGDLSADTVIRAATASGRLDEVTAAVARAALATTRQAADLLDSRPLLTLNVEIEQLHPGGAFLEAVLAGHDPERVALVLEVSERGIGGWSDQHGAVATELAGRGILLAVDDLGSGESRVPILMRHRWHLIKLDQAFFNGPDTTVEPVLAHTTQLVQELGMIAVVEGLETPERLALARRAGLHYGQGNLLCEPLPSGRLLERLQRDGLGALPTPFVL
jgi:diguanylate cyclase (GGDEF)-like protein